MYEGRTHRGCCSKVHNDRKGCFGYSFYGYRYAREKNILSVPFQRTRIQNGKGYCGYFFYGYLYTQEENVSSMSFQSTHVERKRILRLFLLRLTICTREGQTNSVTPKFIKKFQSRRRGKVYMRLEYYNNFIVAEDSSNSFDNIPVLNDSKITNTGKTLMIKK